MCIKDNFNEILQSGDEGLINLFMNECESNCVKYGSCDYHTMLDEQLRMIHGEAGRCSFCNEIYNFEDMTEGNTGWYCDRCQRAIESRA